MQEKERTHAPFPIHPSFSTDIRFMSKRNLVIGLLVAVVAAIGYFSYDLLTESDAEQQAVAQQEQFPTGMLQTTGGDAFEFSTVRTGKPVVLMFFSPTCPYCQQETAEITQHGKLPAEATIIMVANAPRGQLNAYIDEYNLNNFENIRVLRDLGGAMFKKYGVQSVPFTIVYDDSHQFVRSFRGKANVDRLYAAATSPESIGSAPAQ